MQMVKNAFFGLTHAALFMGSIAATFLLSMFYLCKPVADFMMHAGFNPLFTMIFASVVFVIGPIVALAVWVLYPWQNWLEDELRRRERLTCKLCRQIRERRQAAA